MALRRTQMPRGKVQLQRTGRWRAKLTAKRRVKRETRAAWALKVKARDRRCMTLELGIFVVFRPFDRLRISEHCTYDTTDAHHVLPKSAGGPDEMWNGLGLCNNCHMAVHDNREAAQALGLLAHVGDCSELPQ